MRSFVHAVTCGVLSMAFFQALSTDTAAQYRASVGCSATTIDQLSPETSLSELQCRCFNRCSRPPSTSSVDHRLFKTVEGRDIDGNDYKTIRDVNFDACVSQCQSDNQCVAFSFDKWNRYCFLKHAIPATLRIEPNSIVGVISTASPNVSNAPLRIERYRRKAFPDAPYKQYQSASLEQCEATCYGEDRCEVLTYDRVQKTCKLIARPGEWWADASADSGVKRQVP